MLNLLDSNNSWVSYVLIAVLLVVLVGSMILMNRRSKKREQEAEALINAVKPGNKVKTIGGICGIVVEIDPDENTFVLETGSETTGKSYIKFVRQAIFESDAVVETPAKGKKLDEPAEEVPPAENVAESAVETPAEESAPAENGEDKE